MILSARVLCSLFHFLLLPCQRFDAEEIQ